VTDSPSSPSEAFSILLELQQHDTTIDQLRHRSRTLAERAELEEVHSRLRELRRRFDEVRARHSVVSESLKELAGQVDAAKLRKADIERRLYGGSVTSARDLQAMDGEVHHLVQHVDELEERQLELMEQLDPLDAEIDEIDDELDVLDKSASELRERIEDAEVTIEAEITVESSSRENAAARLPPDLLTHYETIRARLGGVGAARLVGNTCGGCHLALPAVEVDRIRKAPADSLITCDQCGRILVR
jgi:predicted  nucleic acid-binding Zn-ribbon protein